MEKRHSDLTKAVEVSDRMETEEVIRGVFGDNFACLFIKILLWD